MIKHEPWCKSNQVLLSDPPQFQDCDCGAPGIPPLPKKEVPTEPNSVVAICGECGLQIQQIMNYSCPNPRCPTGMGPIIC